MISIAVAVAVASGRASTARSVATKNQGKQHRKTDADRNCGFVGAYEVKQVQDRSHNHTMIVF